MKTKLAVLIIALGFWVLPAPGFPFSVSLLGIPNLAQPVDGAGTYVRDLGYGGGIILDSSSKPYAILETQSLIYFSYELGIFYLNRNYTAAVGDITYHFSTPEEQFQFLVRTWVSRYLSLGVGGYASYNPGQIVYNSTEGGSSSDPTNRFDYGIVTSVRLGLYLGFTQFFLDGRYAVGLANQVSDGAAHYDNYQLLIGFRLGSTPFYDVNTKNIQNFGYQKGSHQVFY